MELQHHRPEHIAEIAASIQARLESSVREIRDIHERTHVLSINARIEAARSGKHGVGFKIVADEFGRLNNEIDSVSNALAAEIQQESKRLMEISDVMAKQVRGQRLSQIALSVMDVIDRNLYERSCDVRWWATDPAAVKALETGDAVDAEEAGRRLGVILDSYTVYADLVLVDAKGIVRANGRPASYRSKGASVASESWFEASLGGSPDTYSFRSVHKSPLVGNKNILAYGCGIAGAEGRVPLGALGILFDWESLERAVMGRVTGIDLKEDIEVLRLPTNISIVDAEGVVLSSTIDSAIGSPADYVDLSSVLASKGSGYRVDRADGGTRVVAWGYSPGFETYATGWYCVIDQLIDSSD